MLVGLFGQLAHQVAAFGRGEPRVNRFANDAKSEQGEVFAWISAHAHLVQGDGVIQPAQKASSPRPGRRAVIPTLLPCATSATQRDMDVVRDERGSFRLTFRGTSDARSSVDRDTRVRIQMPVALAASPGGY